MDNSYECVTTLQYNPYGKYAGYDMPSWLNHVPLATNIYNSLKSLIISGIPLSTPQSNYCSD